MVRKVNKFIAFCNGQKSVVDFKMERKKGKLLMQTGSYLMQSFT